MRWLAQSCVAMRIPFFLFCGWLGLALAGEGVRAAQAPNPTEVFELLRTNLPGITDAQLQVAAVEGLVKELAPRVWLAGTSGDSGTNNTSPALLKAEVLPGPALYLRIGRIAPTLAGEIETAFTAVTATNQLQGVIADLRFATGTDYAAAGAVAALAVPKERLLLDWGSGQARSTANADAPNLPLVLLVNHQTEGAAEALAAALRDAGAVLVIGTNTAGRAMTTEEFKLSNGQRLCLARKGVRLGSGVEMTANGLTPDITVRVAPADEKAWWADPYRDLSAGASRGSASTASGTNAPRRRFNEAELVRSRREGTNAASAPAVGTALEDEANLIRDPVLARGLDLLKGLAVVRRFQAR